eukprot:TRINITY_DN8684_c0_g1_i2.p1 TRINITY_DN8684_c0_g1~~TRINITY_DN8684_c0_g1_i2.p1  ORF type:complete len:541 (+),score=137.12 TRINITY_DN8684_c0_g1_i2:148-1770(+)
MCIRDRVSTQSTGNSLRRDGDHLGYQARSGSDTEAWVTMEETDEEHTINDPTYLVTGGCGFVGRKIVEALRKGGQRVLVLDHKPMPDIPAWRVTEKVSYMQADMRDQEAVTRACAGIETIFHTARMSDPNGEYALLSATNVTGTKVLLAAAKQQGVRSLVYTSSVSVVVDGNDINGGDESMPYSCSHLDHASATKCLAERLVLEANCESLYTCALRPEMVFGPGDNHFVPQILDKAREGEMTHMIGDGDNVVDFTYIDNVILAHLLAAEHLFQDSPVCGSAYFITNGEVMPFWEFLRGILDGMGFPVPSKAIGTKLAYTTALALEKVGGLLNYFVRFKPKLTRQLVFNMSKNHYFQHTKATKDFGYKPVVALEDGIRRTLDFYRTSHAVNMDPRVFEVWGATRSSLWGLDRQAVSLQPSRANSSASLDSLGSREGLNMMLESRPRRLSYAADPCSEEDPCSVLDEPVPVRLSFSGADAEEQNEAEPARRKGRAAPNGRRSPGHSLCARIPEHTNEHEYTERHSTQHAAQHAAQLISDGVR